MNAGRRAWILSLALTLFCMTLLYLTRGLGHAARMVPGKVLPFTCALVLLQLLQDLLPALGRAGAAFETLRWPRIQRLTEESRAHVAADAADDAPRPLPALLWVLALPVAVVVAGSVLGVLLYTLVYLKRRAKQNRGRNEGYGATFHSIGSVASGGCERRGPGAPCPGAHPSRLLTRCAQTA